MKFILICPAERSEIAALAESAPLVNLCTVGKPFIFCWLEHVAGCGAKEVNILAADRPEQVRDIVGDGSRWGLRVEVIPQPHELTCAEAGEKFSSVIPLNQIILIDHFPKSPETNIFLSYAHFFSAAQSWFLQNAAAAQIGMKEIQPGIWVGMHTHLSPRATFHAPCWIGENVLVEADAQIGPMAILENGAAVQQGATIQHSWIGQQTFVGSLTQVKQSFALGNTLVNYRTDSAVKIPDAFLLCSLRNRNLTVRPGNLFGRVAALLALLATLPFALVTMVWARITGHRVLRPRRATPPHWAGEGVPSILYYEFTIANGWWKRWPQLWNVVRGEFTWIGNRPLTSIEAGKLTNEFERLWLTSPIGLISQGDAEGCSSLYSDEARAHASFYAASASWKLDVAIFSRALKRLLRGNLAEPLSRETNAFKQPRLPIAAR